MDNEKKMLLAKNRKSHQPFVGCRVLRVAVQSAVFSKGSSSRVTCIDQLMAGSRSRAPRFRIRALRWCNVASRLLAATAVSCHSLTDSSSQRRVYLLQNKKKKKSEYRIHLLEFKFSQRIQRLKETVTLPLRHATRMRRSLSMVSYPFWPRRVLHKGISMCIHDPVGYVDVRLGSRYDDALIRI